MGWLFHRFKKTIGFGLLLLTLYWLPADLMGAGEALGPWQAVAGTVDREVALLVITLVVFSWLAWNEVKPVLTERFFMPKWQRSVRGKPPAYLKIGVDAGSVRPRFDERFNICSFYITPADPFCYLVIVFEVDVGIESIRLVRGDGSPIRHNWIDVGPSSAIAHVKDVIKKDGLIFHCENVDDRTMAPRAIPDLLQSHQSIGVETPPKSPPD